MDELLVAGLLAILGVSIRLSIVDLRTHRLPNRIVGPLAAGVVLWLLALGALYDDFGRALAAIGWGLAAVGVFFVLHLVAGLGMGDVKYAGPVAVTLGWFGWDAIRVGLVVLVISGGVVGAAVLCVGRGRDRRIAYGPLMAVGLTAGVVYGLSG